MTYRNIIIQVNTLNFFVRQQSLCLLTGLLKSLSRNIALLVLTLGGRKKIKVRFRLSKYTYVFSIKFLLECVEDLEEQLAEVGSKLHFIRSLMDFSFIFTICIKALRICALTNLYFLRCCRGNPVDVFRKLSKKVKIEKLCFDQELK